MLTAFTRAFRTPDLRKKLLFTVGIVMLFRFGSVMPSPGVSTSAVNTCLDSASADSSNVYSLINLFSGGALLQLSIFALGIMPYITSSIIIQLLVVVIPRLEQLKKEGSSGEQKLTQYTRYLTIALGLLQATGIVALARSGRLFPSCSAAIIPDTSLFRIATIVITMTAGTSVIMWMGELITTRGVGNGMSLLIFTSIAARLPSEGGRILQVAGGVVFSLVLLLGLAIVVFVVFVEQSQRRIPVQYAKRLIGRRMYGGTSTYLPIKVNQAGIIPVIFASSLLQLPQLAGQVWSNRSFQDFEQRYLSRGDHPLYLVTYFALIIFFTYFYVAITFNPTEVADNMKKYGGFIPGIRPGNPTAEYLKHVLDRITLPGSLFLGVITVLPLALLNLTKDQPFPFAGTSVLIMVGVGLETVKQIESQLMLRNYEGFLR
ncbi:protein translocase subunit secY/sec61 alpha [Frankia casuarinae]|uniref:Protein translocase subunit SecY n=3 Tax=Frankia TaxID=1854 RepID=Q2JFF6_FRACC|nr:MULTISPECIES: preprotein translocase subunit SecY [Frankia]AYF60756.1 protein translocase subunit SecY [uncultured Frankia sp.]ABD09986.1 protein translocase subunit secY/sec61 alpha [Frankia casuarinae]ETA04304.1 protein translocase subunit secY/sec61 alpha [Frankia sp. CcI6]EYT92223.1 protein translocase subunit secY/sec61 alpha [Frankia casuarinae]OHV50735.1 preprotein translocase subunit SecY [Frankia sp. CgIS1]